MSLITPSPTFSSLVHVPHVHMIHHDVALSSESAFGNGSLRTIIYRGVPHDKSCNNSQTPRPSRPIAASAQNGATRPRVALRVFTTQHPAIVIPQSHGVGRIPGAIGVDCPILRVPDGELQHAQQVLRELLDRPPCVLFREDHLPATVLCRQPGRSRPKYLASHATPMDSVPGRARPVLLQPLRRRVSHLGASASDPASTRSRSAQEALLPRVTVSRRR